MFRNEEVALRAQVRELQAKLEEQKEICAELRKSGSDELRLELAEVREQLKKEQQKAEALEVQLVLSQPNLPTRRTAKKRDKLFWLAVGAGAIVGTVLYGFLKKIM